MKGDFSRWTFDPTKHYSAVLDQQGRVQTDADRIEAAEIAGHLRRQALRDVIGPSGAPQGNPGFALQVDDAGGLVIGAGGYYVDGLLCVNEADVPFAEQPDLPGQPLPEFTGELRRFLVYLDVWQRHVTMIEDPALREVELGGPDTTTRERVCCGVRLFEVETDAHCLSPLPLWQAHIDAGDGRLAARAEPPDEDAGLCEVPPNAHHTGLRSQLYRIEVHQGGAPGEATFKWDRDNGSVAYRIEAFLDGQPTDRLRIARAGRWALSELDAEGDVLLELTDDLLDLAGEPGPLRRIASLDPATGILTLDEAVDGLSADHHPKLRRWLGEETTIPADDAFVPLENGVEVRFEGSLLRPGQHWLVPARTQTRDVEWPTQPNDDGELEPLAQSPLGVHHAFARLAIVDLTDTGFEVVSDCRVLFPGLAHPTLRIERILRASDDSALALNSQIRPNNLSAGLIFEFSAPVSAAALALTEDRDVSLHGAIEVVLDLPDPLSPEDREFWGFARTFGFRPLTVAATVTPVNEPTRLLWRPVPQAQVFLGRLFTRLNTSGNQDEVNRVRARLQIRGQALWADGPDGQRVHLDGRSLANPDAATSIDLSAGNGLPGDDLHLWFWLLSENAPAPLDLEVGVNLNVVFGTLSSAGSAVEGGVITLRSDSITGSGTQTAETDAHGEFDFTALPGEYTVTAEALGGSVEQTVEVGQVLIDPGGGGGGGNFTGPGNLSLLEIDGIGPARAAALERNGITTVAAFAALSATGLAAMLPRVSEDSAEEMLIHARGLLNP
jgi:hypothetical protein